MRRVKGLLFVLVLSITTSLATAQGVKFEAEDQTLLGVTKASSRAGFSGTGYVTGFDAPTDKVVFTVEWDKSGPFEIFIGFAAPYGDKKNFLFVNDENMGEISFLSSNTFMELSAGNIYLNKGSNTVSIVNSWGWFELDYIRIGAARETGSWNIAPAPVNPNITPQAKAMYQFLLQNFGKTTFGGQFQHDARWYTDTNSEIQHIYNITGKFPALYGNDLIEYSPSRVQFGSSSNATQDILKWHTEKGGMITLTWHWNAPTDLINSGDQLWWKGFYTEATTFDIATTMNNPESERYNLVLRDIDAIAVQLKIYQEAGIPILWRPLHEAEGAWFWWGAKGPEACVKLWHLLYDRITNYHGINNLLWVWTTTDSPNALQWYPGDEYVDILGVDVYLNDGDYSASSTMFQNLKQQFGGKKMLAMSENGTIPDPEKMISQQAPWLYICTWMGSFIFDGKKNTEQHISYFFNHEFVTTLDELPTNWMEFTSVNKMEVNPKIKAYTSNNGNLLKLELSDGIVPEKVTLFDLMGRNVGHFNMPSKEHSYIIDISLLHSGIYLVKIVANNKPIIIKFRKHIK
jgi:mannan endo-1,4-beta-mannosidase